MAILANMLKFNIIRFVVKKLYFFFVIRADPGMLTQLGEDLPIRILEAPVSYYWDLSRRYLPSFREIPFGVATRLREEGGIL